MNFLPIDDDKYIPDLKKLTKAIRTAGSKSCLQLLRSGRYAFSLLTGEQPVSASEVQSPLSGDVPRALSVEEIKEMVTLFTDGALRAKEAGFDAVEICDGVVVVETEGGQNTLEADTVVITSGYIEENRLYKEFEGKDPDR